MLRNTFHLTGTAPASRPLAKTLRALRESWGEALAAHRRYEHLTSQGVAHDPALKEALGICIPAGEVRIAGSRAGTRCRSKPHTGERLAGQAQIGNLTFVR
jgi:hypothetical protein